MDEVIKQDLRFGKNPKIVQITKELSDYYKTSDRVGFAVTYTSTEGNLDVHERFVRFCAQNANNEYLLGISKLLEYAEFVTLLLDIDRRLQVLEKGSVKPVVEETKVIVDKEVKTIG